MEEVDDDVLQISLANARLRDIHCELGDLVHIESNTEKLWTYRRSEGKAGGCPEDS